MPVVIRVIGRRYPSDARVWIDHPGYKYYPIPYIEETDSIWWENCGKCNASTQLSRDKKVMKKSYDML